MTHLEYMQKRDAIAVSDAPIEIREQAMKNLDAKYLFNPSEEARKQFLESTADISDIRGNL